MNFEDIRVGYAVFFGVPIVLWLLVWWGMRSSGAGLVALIAGSDNRLSLSRLQALTWTLVIIGSFAAATAMREPIRMLESPNAAASAERDVETRTAELEAAIEQVTTIRSERAAAEEAVRTAELLVAVSAVNRDESEETEAEHAANETTLEQARATLTALTQQVRVSEASLETAETEKEAADKALASYRWVQIPPELLWLAGIALGSGVLSSMISSTNQESLTASITSVVGNSTDNTITITGDDFGSAGQVRINKHRVAVQTWAADGTQIIATLPTAARTLLTKPGSEAMLVIDTSNGKLCHNFVNDNGTLQKGPAVSFYEWGDLFASDSGPGVSDPMKFQMFAWTVVAVVTYSWLFLTGLDANVAILPQVDASIVTLTGVSQGGYLAAKRAT